MIENAEFYVRSHLEVIKQCLALSKVDPRYIDTARRATEFALTNISDGRDRIVDKESNASTPATIQIGIALGGMPTKRLTDGTNE